MVGHPPRIGQPVPRRIRIATLDLPPPTNERAAPEIGADPGFTKPVLSTHDRF